MSSLPTRILKPRLKQSSTDRRKNTAYLIKLLGNEMPTKCSPYKEAGRVYKVYVRSGRYGSYNASNNPRYNILVTASEFRRLAKERSSLKEKMSLYRTELDAARIALEAAYERYSVALAKEGRLLK